MSTTVTMPQLGETVTEGTILRWAKQVGDNIGEDEVLVEISTDKVDTEVPSPAAGVVQEILVPEGETVKVGTPLAVIGDGAEAPAEAPQEGEEQQPAEEQPAEEQPAEAAAPEPQPEQPAAAEAEQPSPPPPAQPPSPPPAAEQQPSAPAPPPQPRREPSPPAAAKVEELAPTTDGPAREVLSPVVRKLVRENGVDLSQVSGTGEGGRITRRDVEAYIEGREAKPAAAEVEEAPAPEPEPAAAPPPAAPAPPAPPLRAVPEAPAPMAPPAPAAAATGEEEVALDRLRVRIGENMIRAKQTAAHVWTSVEVDYERVERVRQAHKEAWKSEEGFSLTYLPFISRATIDALKEFPVVNSSFYLEEKKAVFHRAVNLGIAIDVDHKALLVATIRNADGLRLVGLARKIRELAEKARAGKLEPDDVAGSTFTITNPGPYGSFMSAPIINVPNVGILSTETVVKRPAVITTPEGQDTIAIRHIGYLGLSWDHRAFDGSVAVLFLQRIKQNLENWDWEQELA
jgi:pyruvate dehydrogenase E2 component (dihydrolipoamide acetyltransferase)